MLPVSGFKWTIFVILNIYFVGNLAVDDTTAYTSNTNGGGRQGGGGDKQEDPGPDPGADPGPDPAADPSPDPGPDPSPDPGASTSPDPEPDSTTAAGRCCPDVGILVNGTFSEIESRVEKLAVQKMTKDPKKKIELILSKLKNDIMKNMENPSPKISTYLERVSYEVLKNFWTKRGKSKGDIEHSRRRLKAYFKANSSDFELNDNSYEMDNDTRKDNSTTNLDSKLKRRRNDDIEIIDTASAYLARSPTCDCDCMLTKACNGIRTVKEFSCQDSEKSIPIYKVCDGMVDCLDESDEYKCYVIAREAVNNVQRLLNGLLQTSFINCLTEQNFAVEDIQDSISDQQTYVSNYELNPIIQSIEKGTIKSKQKRNEMATEGFVIVSSVSLALGPLICESSEKDTISKNSINFVEGDHIYNYKIIYPADSSAELSDEPLKPWGLKPTIGMACSCDGKKCIDSECTPECKLICNQRYMIGRWPCITEDNEESISLDDLCDGKIDCVDKSDENDCNNGNHYTQFTANGKINTVIKLLITKLASDDFRVASSRLSKIVDAVKDLQKQNSKKSDVTLEEIRIKRDEAFEMLKLLYDDVTPYIAKTKLSDVFEFIMTVCKNLATALKQTNVGNVKVITSEECECKDTKCDMLQCTQQCIRYCNVRSHFASIICSDSYKTVDFSKICNSKLDCANGDDEKDCRKDMCLKRHLKQLEVDLRLPWIKDSSLGGILGAWRRSVLELINKAHGAKRRLTVTEYRIVVYSAIRKLLMLFASIEDLKKSNSSLTWNTFLDICHVLMNALKYCGK